MRKLKSCFVVIATGLVIGCGFMTAAPEEVAQKFWDASMEGDFDRAEEYVTASSRDMMDRAENTPDLEDVTLGAAEIEDNRAKVHTTLIAIVNDRPMEIEFSTILDREDKQWKVNLTATTGQMLTQFMGGAAGEMMSQIGEAVGEQMRGLMEGMMKGLAEGMQEAGRGLQEAMDSTGN